jgi:hypothetical protein
MKNIENKRSVLRIAEAIFKIKEYWTEKKKLGQIQKFAGKIKQDSHGKKLEVNRNPLYFH